MEIIRTYLENMFLSLPATPEVIRAKRELLDMMEDKYRELRAEGKTENEAVGTVISEFGNLDELAETLGIERIIRPEAARETESAASRTASEGTERAEAEGAWQDGSAAGAGAAASSSDEPDVTTDIAKQYLKESTRQAVRVGLGVALCICSPVFVIVASAFDSLPGAGVLEAIGVIILFVMVAAAVGIFIFGSMRMSEWKDVKFGGVQLSFYTIEYLREQKTLFKPMYALFLTLGIMMCILSPVPVVIAEAIGSLRPGAFSDGAENIGAAILLVIVAIGVFFIIYATKRYGAIRNLLKRGGISIDDSAPTGEEVRERTEPKEKKDKKKMKSEEKRFKELWNDTVLCLYLVWSFLTFRWWITWIIFPIANWLYKIVRNYKFREE